MKFTFKDNDNATHNFLHEDEILIHSTISQSGELTGYMEVTRQTEQDFIQDIQMTIHACGMKMPIGDIHNES